MRPAEATPSVCAITVTHRPDRDALRSLIAGISAQVDGVVVIDNASLDGELPDLSATGSPVAILCQPANIGLAAAQNIGVAWARAHGHTHVLLLDQDSSPSPDMVGQLLTALAQLTADGRRVAAVGPRFHDQREDRDAPFVRVAFPVSEKIWCSSSPFVECDFLIGSGALIPIAVLDDVGAMDQSLFIDNIDLEWSFRSRSRGYTLFGVCAARMDHRLGDDRRSVLFGLRQVVTHAPTRLYYIMRNRTILYRLASTPRVWIAQDLLRIPFKFVIFAVLVGPRRRNVSMMLAGLRDGLLGRGGPIPAQRYRA